nr:response regulator transcription factor [uncultured Enterobacter sp.]
MSQANGGKIRIAIADEQPIVLMGLRTALSQLEQLQVMFSCTAGDKLLGALKGCEPPCDILLMDVTFSQGSNDDSFRLVKKIIDSKQVKHIFIFTDVRCGWTMNKLTKLGVSCILSKRDDLVVHLNAALSAIRRHKPYFSPYIDMLLEQSNANELQSSMMANLTERELQVIRLYVDGLRLKDIAEKLCRSVATVAVHKHNAMQKLNIHNNIHLVTYVRSLSE